MAVWEILVLITVSVLGGIKSTYGMELWKEKKSSVFLVWSKRQMYVMTGVWMLFYSLIWATAGKNIRMVRIVDFLCTYGILALIDGKRKIVPDGILICYFAGQMLLGALCTIPEELCWICLKGLTFAAILGIFVWFSKGKIGIGDAKLLGVTAMTTGWKYTFQLLATALFLSFLYSICLIVFQKKDMRTEIPFVPFLAAGAAVQIVMSVCI